MNRKFLQSNSKGAFTLMELMVVIGILAILAGILFPVFARSKKSSFEAVAISNVRQLYVGMSLYLNDNGDRFPIEKVTLHSGIERYWTQTVGNYISKITPTGPHGTVLDDDLPKVFFDPGKPYISQPKSGKLARAGISGWGLSDDLSNQASPTWDPFGQPFGPPYNSSSVVKPASTLMLTETIDSLVEKYSGYAEAISPLVDLTIEPPGTIVNTDIDAPYGGNGPVVLRNGSAYPANLHGFNITVYCDGHAKPTHVSEIIGSGKLWSISGNGQWP